LSINQSINRWFIALKLAKCSAIEERFAISFSNENLSLKIWDFRRLLKVEIFLASRMVGGKLFHIWGPATALSPNVLQRVTGFSKRVQNQPFYMF
jgi:hypothetical protein